MLSVHETVLKSKRDNAVAVVRTIGGLLLAEHPTLGLELVNAAIALDSVQPSNDQADHFTPSDADNTWAAQNLDLPMPLCGGAPEPFEPSDADWDDMARWCEWVETMDMDRFIRDEDLQAAGLPVG
jgi:hypothetical protein